MGEPRLPAEPLSQLIANRVELIRADRPHELAGLADEVLLDAAARAHVEAGGVAEVEVADDPGPLEPLEVAIDRRDVAARDIRGDLLRRCLLYTSPSPRDS